MSYRVDSETMRGALETASFALIGKSPHNKKYSRLEIMEQEYNIKFVPHTDGGTMDDDLDVIFPTEHDYTLFLLKWG